MWKGLKNMVFGSKKEEEEKEQLNEEE